MSAPSDPENLIQVDELLAARDWIERLARALVRSGAGSGDAEELVQDTLGAALADPGRRARSGPALRSWLGTVMRRRVLEERRSSAHRRGREQAVARPEGQLNSTLEVERAELRRFLVDEVLLCPEPIRSTLVLRYFEGHSYAEVAERTGTTAAAARQRASRGLAQLRERLDERSGGDRSVWMSALTPLAGPPAKFVWGYAAGAACLVGLAAIGAFLLYPRGATSTPGPMESAAVEVPLDPDTDVAAEASDIKPVAPLASESREAAAEPIDLAGGSEAASPQKARLAFPVAAPGTRATLEVEVISATSSRPIPGYPLEVSGRTVRVDQRGRALVADLNPGEIFYASPLGVYGSVEVEAGMTESLTIRAESGYVLHGRVTDGAGEPLLGAEVRGAKGTGGYGVLLATSGAGGLFVVKGVAGGISLFAAHPDAGMSKRIWLSRAPQDGDVVELAVSSGAAGLRVAVVDELDVPVVGARVILELLQGKNEVEEGKHWKPDWRFRGHTDSYGLLTIDSWVPGPSRLIVATGELATHVEAVRFAVGETVEKTVRLQPGRTLAGRVLLSPGGRPARRVSVLAGDDFHWDGIAANTDDDGHFLIPKVPQDQATVTVQPFYGEREVFPIEPGADDELELVLELISGWHTAEGELVDEDGQPLAGWDVGAMSGSVNLGVGTTDERGRFQTLAIAPHFRSLEFSDPDNAWSSTTLLGILPSAAPLRIVVPREHMATSRVRGRVVDTDGAPVPNAQVYFDPFIEAITDRSGAFSFEGARSGTHWLVVDREGFATAQTEVTVDEKDDVDLGSIRLERSRVLRLEVTFEPALADGKTVEIYERRGAGRLAWVGDVKRGPFEVTRASAGARDLVLRSWFLYHEFTVDESALEAGLQTLHVAWHPPRIVELRYANADGSEALEDEVVSLGLTWTLNDEFGRVVRERRHRRRLANGGELRITGIPKYAVWTLDVVDDEGRRGTIELTGARQVLEMR